MLKVEARENLNLCLSGDDRCSGLDATQTGDARHTRKQAYLFPKDGEEGLSQE